MKKSIFLMLAMTLFAAPQMFAAIESQLFLDAGGTTATIDVNTGGTVTCSGTCAGLSYTLAGGDHGTLQVTGSLGNFTINTTGQGEATTVDPTRQNLNQIQVKNTAGAGTLTARYTDTSYANLGPQFVLAASIVNDIQIIGSTTDFTAYGSAANSVPAGTLIGSFSGLTGLSSATGGAFANPIGLTGSLTTLTVINFTGSGTVQANFTISNAAAPIPEPSSVALLGSVCVAAAFGLRRKFAARA